MPSAVTSRCGATGTHRTVSHGRALGGRHTQNPINGIEDFWSYAKHILRNYRGVSRRNFPMYLKEIEYRFNHRKEDLFKNFLRIRFGQVLLNRQIKKT